jgi:pre-rRNA-processing protein TSR3
MPSVFNPTGRGPWALSAKRIQRVVEVPPTILVVHRKERRKKCTVEPLRGRKGFAFHNYPPRPATPLEGYVRLGFGGPLLSKDDAVCGLLLLDGTWRRAEEMERDYADLPVRSLPQWTTAYPRVSKTFDNPAGGLATIEALYAAYAILGRDAAGLLDGYHWADEFLERNAHFLGAGGISAQCKASTKS